MRKALLSEAFQAAIPHFPKATGMEVINFFQSNRHPRDAVVLCRRAENETSEEEYVTWVANMVEGGCHNGFYFAEYEDALYSFKSRVMTLS